MAWTDGEVFEGLVEQVEGAVEPIDAEGAYDSRSAYAVAAARETTLVVPPRDHAIPWETVIHGMRCWTTSLSRVWRNGSRRRAHATDGVGGAWAKPHYLRSTLKQRPFCCGQA